MSWDSYIDNLIAQTKDASGTAHADKACIIGLAGGAAWTTAGHANALKLQGSEGANIAKAFKAGDFTSFQAGGVYAEGVKYQFLREEDGKLVVAKKKDQGALTLQSSKTAIVIAHTPEGCQQGNTNKGVRVIAEYLESLGM
ncbi:profilin-like [Xenia sp. Carnegie-2017]|uniref:profilin-like n=1 Tax=Xenia sp. Carnegie-2017 TaxID=2897299 RepID=UPI001F04B514|nr:profilin-like [Xenia sp. Carnegie-2017]